MPNAPLRRARAFRFGPFELAVRAGELRKHGIRLRLREQPLQILLLLLEQPGEVVLREEIRLRLWPNNTIVEFDHGINAAIQKLRDVLGESAGQPRYIETVARRGYRFLGQVETVEEPAPALPVIEATRLDISNFEGRVISHYCVLQELGSGGMGVVFKAQDTTLNRFVALKFLPEEYREHPPALDRLKKEARAAAAINHPNICTLYEIEEHSGQTFLVMEFMDGATLKDRIGDQPVPLELLLDWAVQIADGLEAANARGIVHRDIKPANVFITTRGQAKILDFGVAKIAEAADGTSGPTKERLRTPGIPVGTPAYMSPEQARGEELDARTDLFSFGAVLYEMATGLPAFTGATTFLVPASTVNPRIPQELDRIIAKALKKDRKLRYQHAAEMRADLRRLERDIGPKERADSHWLVSGVAVVILVAATVVYLAWDPGRRFGTSPPPSPPKHRQITFLGDAINPSISPDGKFVAFITGEEGQGVRLMLQDLSGGHAIELSNAPEIYDPRWSPDGTELAALVLTPPDKVGIYLIPRLGGEPRFIGGGMASWSPSGNQIAIAVANTAGFKIIDRTTGIIKSVHLNGRFQRTWDIDWSHASDFLAVGMTSEDGRQAIWTVHPDGTQQSKVFEADDVDSPRWSLDGDAIYCLRYTDHHTHDLLKVAIDQRKGTAKHTPLVLFTGLEVGESFTVSGDGTRLAYTKSFFYSNLWLIQFDTPDSRSEPGKELQRTQITTGTFVNSWASLSPDGKWIAFEREGHLYKMLTQGGNSTQLTFSGNCVSPAWSPDGKQIAFGSLDGGAYKVWMVDADGTNRHQFAKTQLSEPSVGMITWSRLRGILYQTPGLRNLNSLDPKTGEVKPLFQNKSVGTIFSPLFSPDGSKIAVYWRRSPQSGIWVISLIDGSEKFLFASDNATIVGWAPDSGRVFASVGKNVLSIPLGGGPAPHTAFTLPVENLISMGADGKTFVYEVDENKSDVWIVDNFDPAYRK